MKVFPYPANNVLVDGKNIFFIKRDEEKLSLVRFQYPSACLENIASFRGSDSLFLGKLEVTPLYVYVYMLVKIL